MNLKLQGLGTEGLVRKDTGTKVVQVKAKHFKRLKSFSVFAVLLTLASTFAVMYLSSKTKDETAENNRLQSQIVQLQTKINSQANDVDSLTAEKSDIDTRAVSDIESIQNKLGKINDYLKKRGLSSISFKKISTGAGKQQPSGDQLYSDYDNYLSRLVSNISMIPMGYPHISALTSFFGYRANPFDFGNSEFHPGIDFKGRVGDAVKCTASGKVVFSGREGGYGNCIHIKHTNNLETWYGHLSHIDVREGQHVTAGDVIGRVGSTGRSTGPHLHYEVRKNGHPVNPIAYLSLK